MAEWLIAWMRDDFGCSSKLLRTFSKAQIVFSQAHPQETEQLVGDSEVGQKTTIIITTQRTSWGILGFLHGP